MLLLWYYSKLADAYNTHLALFFNHLFYDSTHNNSSSTHSCSTGLLRRSLTTLQGISIIVEPMNDLQDNHDQPTKYSR